MKRLLLLTLLPFLAGVSCSVKEDRSECPALLIVSLDRIPSALRDVPIRLEVAAGETLRWQADVMAGDGSVTLHVPRGPIRIDAVWEAGSPSGVKAILPPSGSEADSLFAYRAFLECRSESVADTVFLHKQWCRLSLRLLNAQMWENYHFEITGNWNGLRLDPLEPIPGPLRIQPRRVWEDRYEARILRQGDDSLQLEVFGSDSGPKAVASYPLGRMMREAGFSWQDEDLKDVNLTLDPTRAVLEVEIAPWDESRPIGDITI